MPQPLSSLKKGIKFESTLGTENAPLLENLTLTLVGQTDMLATTTGGALLTVNPDKQTTAKTVTLLEGGFVDIALEFNGAGLFRVKVTPLSDISTVSAWMPEQTEHNIGVSYNSTLGQIVIAVDGASTLTNADFSGAADAGVNLRIAAAGNGAAAGPGTYDGFIDQLAFFKTAPTVAQIERMTANPDLLRTDFANLAEVPTVTGSVQGLNFRSETQAVVLTGTATAAGTVSFLGTATAAVAIGATATVVGAAIVAAKAAIIAAAGNTFGVTDISNNAGTLTLTFNSSLGSVGVIPAAAASNGITAAAGTEVIAGVAPISETQTVVITGPATAAGVVSYLGVDSTPLVAGSLTINDVGNAIVTNKAAILAGTAAKAANITDISNNAGTLTLTYSRDAGNVDTAAAIALVNGVSFAAATEITQGQTGTPEAHTLTFAGKYRAGDVISIAAGIDSAATETKNYTVLGSDIKSTDALTQQSVAASINTSFASKVGSFTLANPINTNTVTFTGKASAGNLVDPVTTFTGAGGLIENVVLDYFDFTKIAISTNTVTGPGGGTASFLNGKSTPTANAVVSQDYVGTSTSTTTASTTVLPTNGPVYARLKTYTVPAGTTTPELTYEFFVNKSADITGALTSLGFSLDFDETKATYKSFVPGSGATLQQVNTLEKSSGKVVYQWVATTGQTDLSLPVGELTVTMTGAAPYVTSVGMTMSDISINNVFYRQTGTALPLTVDTKLDAERYTATGWIQQMFTPLAATTTAQVPVAQGGTVVSYEVFGAQVNSAVRLDVQDNFVPTSAASPNANIKVDVIANQALASFSLVVNLPSNATGATFTAGTGMTLTKNVVNGTQLSIAGTYVAPAIGASASPTIGTVSLNLVGQHGKGSDFTISDLTVNNTVSVGRSLFFGIAQTDSNGLLSVANLPKGDMVTNVFDNPVAPSSKITIEDARAVLLMASGKNNGATAAAPGGNAWLPSDFIAADWDKNGAVTASDALAILNYVVAVDKSGTQLDYIYIDNALNTQAKTPQKVSSVVVPPIAKILTNKSSDVPPVDYSFGGGHTDVQFVGILVGDLVQ